MPDITFIKKEVEAKGKGILVTFQIETDIKKHRARKTKKPRFTKKMKKVNRLESKNSSLGIRKKSGSR